MTTTTPPRPVTWRVLLSWLKNEHGARIMEERGDRITLKLRSGMRVTFKGGEGNVDEDALEQLATFMGTTRADLRRAVGRPIPKPQKVQPKGRPKPQRTVVSKADVLELLEAVQDKVDVMILELAHGQRDPSVYRRANDILAAALDSLNNYRAQEETIRSHTKVG